MISSYRTAGRGTPDGTRTHRKTHFECVVYANSTTGAYCGSFYELPIFGALAGTRTPKKSATLPIELQALVACLPHCARECGLIILTPARFASKFWWAMVGLNHQPNGYEPPALPVELMALMVPNRGFEPRTF